MLNVIRKFVHKIRELRSWWVQVWKAPNDFDVPFLTKLWYAIKGFTTNEYVWFDLKHNDYRDYISDYERVKSRKIDGEYKRILDDKLLFEEVFHKYIRVPQIYAWISDGNIYGIHGYEITKKNIIPFLEKVKKSVLKWETGYEGKGVFVIEALGDNQFAVNGEEVSSNDLFSYLYKNTAIICEYINQSKFSASLYSEATNTIRIVCAKKKGESKANIIRAAQRIGNNNSKPVDNVSAGAIVCPIDINTGKLGSGVIAKRNLIGSKNKCFDIHPDTGAQLQGRIVPGWNELKNKLLQITNQFPYLNLVAWDILLTEDGFCVLEGNASAGCVMFQMEHGIRNEEMGDIFRSYGIIK